MTSQAGHGRTVLLVVCATLGFGTLATTRPFADDRFAAFGLNPIDAGSYSSVAALVLALLAWHFSPRWAWPALVVLGALCAVPAQLALADDQVELRIRALYLVVDGASQPLLLVGLLGVATAVWQAGRHGAGAALLGAPLVVPPLTVFVVVTLIAYFGNDVLPVIGFVFVAATVLAAIAAAVPRPSAPVPRPGWRVTIGGALAGTAPLLFALGDPTRLATQEVDIADAADAIGAYYTELGQHLLVVGLVVLAVALVAGLVAGPRVLVTGAAAGLLLGVFVEVAGTVAVSFGGFSPGALSVLALVAGLALALPRVRTIIGVAGLGVVATWLLVLWLASQPAGDGYRSNTITLVLITLGMVAVPVLGSLGTVVSQASAAPAAFAGVAAGVAAGVTGTVKGLAFTMTDDDAWRYPPAIVLLAVIACLTVLAHRIGRHTNNETTTVKGDS